MTLELGDRFTELDHRMEGRTLKVVGIFEHPAYEVDEGYVACSSRGKITIIHKDRLLNPSRFMKVEDNS